MHVVPVLAGMERDMKKKRTRQRSTALEIASEINSGLGKPVLRLASDPELKIVKIPTPSLTINRITGGGFTLGRHVELYGDPSVGKSAIALGTMALSQQRGNICALVDPEGVFDPEWFSHLGGYPEELIYQRPDDAEDVIGSLRMLGELALRGEPLEVVTIDSISALVTKEQVEKDPREEERVASQARMMSRALRVITTRNTKVLFIWTNQLRSNIGFGAQFQPNVTSGGRALGFYATTRLEFKKTGQVTTPRDRAEKGQLKKKEAKIGDWIQVRAEKEKSTRPYQQGAYIFNSDKGEIELASELIQLGLEDGFIERVGNRYQYETIDGETITLNERPFKKRIIEDELVQEEMVDAISDNTHQLSRMEAE
jgi:recombination protein RecA